MATPDALPIVFIVVGVAILGALIFLFGFFCRKKENACTSPSTSNLGEVNPNVSPAQVTVPPLNSPQVPPLISTSDSSPYYSCLDASRHPLSVQPPASTALSLSFEDLTVATNGFSDENMLGEGGFGYVYRGVLRDGSVVAVKKLKVGSMQGDPEFRMEVEIISKIHHKHLVSLVGYCIHQEERLLVYEFVPNMTLEFHLHDEGQPTMEWSTRMKIALGAAKGLAYLHEDCSCKIIHRDVKASNILLDLNFEVKIADFGLAKIKPEADQSYVSSLVKGTIGYLAPEYASTGKLSEKSDVFSYGVMLLELITGRRSILLKQGGIKESLVDFARPLLIKAIDDDNYNLLIDPRLEQNYNFDQMKRLVACAASCVRHSAEKRPKMGQVVRELEEGVSLEELNCGVTPGRSIIIDASATSHDES